MKFAKHAAILRDRAHMLAQVRAFFASRQVLEVDPCSLVHTASLDRNVESIAAHVTDQETGFLHTSPEYAMKRLLANGLGDIYFLGHVYRKGEIGHLHNPEFCMIEWYRTKILYQKLIDETCELIALFLGDFQQRMVSYREAFRTWAQIDPFCDSEEKIRKAAEQCSQVSQKDCDKDTCLQLILTHQIEPKLGRGELTVLYDFPPSQAALACIVSKDGLSFAERFEIYFAGIELTNGYHELSDANEQRRRFDEENALRQSMGQKMIPIDEQFLDALELGLPDCCGVSVGFDRLMLLRHHVQSIRDVMPFGWHIN